MAIAKKATRLQSDPPLLKTESGELGHNVDEKTLGSLPMLGFSSAIRDAYALTQLIPCRGQLFQCHHENGCHGIAYDYWINEAPNANTPFLCACAGDPDR